MSHFPQISEAAFISEPNNGEKIALQPTKLAIQ